MAGNMTAFMDALRAGTLYVNVHTVNNPGGEVRGQFPAPPGPPSTGTGQLETSGITITASAKVKVNASTVEVSAGMVSVNAGMSKFSGVVQCDTLVSNAVVSASYTPGAGNIW